jgi:carbonic anhydrase
MLEIVWRFDPDEARTETQPATAAEARTLLEDGNRAIAAAVDRFRQDGGAVRHVTPVTPVDLGLASVRGQGVTQEPFAAVLSCADARAPVELLFNQSINDLFVVRVAGNVLDESVLGSLDYAVAHLAGLRLIVVLSHSGCGAVGAAVDAFLDPAAYLGVAANPPLRSIVDALLGPVRIAQAALGRVTGRDVDQMPGYRAALVEIAVAVDAALTASVVRTAFLSRLGERLDVACAVYNLHTRTAGFPAGEGDDEWQPGLFPPPDDAEALDRFAGRIASSPLVFRLLREAATAH